MRYTYPEAAPAKTDPKYWTPTTQWPSILANRDGHPASGQYKSAVHHKWTNTIHSRWHCQWVPLWICPWMWNRRPSNTTASTALSTMWGIVTSNKWCATNSGISLRVSCPKASGIQHRCCYGCCCHCRQPQMSHYAHRRIVDIPSGN